MAWELLESSVEPPFAPGARYARKAGKAPERKRLMLMPGDRLAPFPPNSPCLPWRIE